MIRRFWDSRQNLTLESTLMTLECLLFLITWRMIPFPYMSLPKGLHWNVIVLHSRLIIEKEFWYCWWQIFRKKKSKETIKTSCAPSTSGNCFCSSSFCRLSFSRFRLHDVRCLFSLLYILLIYCIRQTRQHSRSPSPASPSLSCTSSSPTPYSLSTRAFNFTTTSSGYPCFYCHIHNFYLTTIHVWLRSKKRHASTTNPTIPSTTKIEQHPSPLAIPRMLLTSPTTFTTQ